MKKLTSAEEFVCPLEWGANKHLYLEGEDQRSLSVLSQWI